MRWRERGAPRASALRTLQRWPEVMISGRRIRARRRSSASRKSGSCQYSPRQPRPVHLQASSAGRKCGQRKSCLETSLYEAISMSGVSPRCGPGRIRNLWNSCCPATRANLKSLLQMEFQAARRPAEFFGDLRKRAGIGCTKRCLCNQFYAFKEGVRPSRSPCAARQRPWRAQRGPRRIRERVGQHNPWSGRAT